MTERGEIIMRVGAAGPRRVFAVGVLYALGLVTLWLALAGAGASLVALVLAAFGAAALVMGEVLRRATALTLELTEQGLFDSSGRRLAAWDEIERVDRGSFSIRPSNGFALVLREAGPRVWVPGLWWRLGRRVGVGGVTPARPTRAMAEEMALRLGR